jgi:hypothetical protein
LVQLVDNDNDDDVDNRWPFVTIGEGIKEVELLQWRTVSREIPFPAVRTRSAEVQSDKATVEITSRHDGVVAASSGCEICKWVTVVYATRRWWWRRGRWWW